MNEVLPPELLEDEQWEKRYAEVKTLTTKPCTCVIPKLLSMKSDPNRSVRCAVAQGLSSCPASNDAFEGLIEMLTDPEPWVRIRTVQALAEFRETKAPDFLARHLETEEDEKVRATIVKTIGLFGDERFISILLPYLEDEDARVRANTIEGLGYIKSEKLQAILRPFLDDPNSRIRANTARIMASFADGVGASKATFERMLLSSDQYERASAVYALGEMRDETYVGPLLDLFKDKSFVVRRNTIDALAKFGSSIERRVCHRLKSDDPIVRTSCCKLLARIGTKACLRSVIPHLDDQAGDVRSSCEEALDLINERLRNKGE